MRGRHTQRRLLFAYACGLGVILLVAAAAWYFAGPSGEGVFPDKTASDSTVLHADVPAHDTSLQKRGKVSRTAPPAEPAADVFRLFPGARVVETRAFGSTAQDRRKRVSLLDTSFKYPLLRLADTFVRDAQTGEERILARTAMVGDHILVKLRPGVDAGQLDTLNRRYGGRIRRRLRISGLYLVAFEKSDASTVPEKVAAYNGHPGVVDYAEPDYIVFATDTTPNDPGYNDLWGMLKIEAPAAWDVQRGTGHTVVGVIDTGVDYSHEDLSDNIWTNADEVAGNGVDDDGNGFVDDVYGWDFLNEDSDPMDDNSHGTHVAGTIGATGDNALGVVGVVWTTRIMALKFLGADGFGVTSDAVEAVNYATMMRERGVPVRLTNNSWGGGGFDQAMYDAVEAAGAAGMLFVAAAGNEATDNDVFAHYPSSLTLSNVIAVANTDVSDDLAGSSNYGSVSVDLAAPGSSIKSTILSDSYGYKSGTSMAAPHVAGAAALLWDSASGASWQEIREAIFAGVDPVTDLSGLLVTGGRLNVQAALEQLEPMIEHVPLGNTTNTSTAYTVEAVMTPSSLVDTNAQWCFWNTDGATNSFSSNAFVHVSDDRYNTTIPAQPLGTSIHYYLRAETVTGSVALDPTNAPADLHVFSVTEPVSLVITGFPGEFGQPTPSYGSSLVASGAVVSASADPAVPFTNGQRHACVGWTGTGDAPAAGSTNTLTFVIHQPSSVTWQWERQVSLHQSSTPSGIVAATTWWPLAGTGATITAPVAAVEGGTNLHFVEWQVDGMRQPDATHPAVNPVQSLDMSTSRVAVAVYMGASLDSDGDLLPDWWEKSYFGGLGYTAYDDPDGDLFRNHEEYEDFSDPQDPGSVPAGPEVTHTPLADPQAHPAPWTVTATVSDAAGVGMVSLLWSRNGLSWREAAMATNETEHGYTGTIPPLGVFGDTFSYTIHAVDAVGYATESDTNTFFVAYPVSRMTPTNVERLLLKDASTNVVMHLTNSGNADLTWSSDFGALGLEEDVESGQNGWTHSGQNDLWHMTDHRSTSTNHAWYCGVSATTQYIDSMDARLLSPPILLGTGAQLTFQHWPAMELEYADYAWDGGIVEISTDDGASFMQITPVGGYPYLVMDNDASPFAADTPCFAGTGGWETATFDLSAYAGEEVQLRFRFGSDGLVTREGWILDDITVTPVSRSMDWAGLQPTNGVVAPGGETNMNLHLDGSVLPTGSDDRMMLRVLSNDPETPAQGTELVLRVRSIPSVVGVSATQTSTNGQGLVTVTNEVTDADGEACTLELVYSTDEGSSWHETWLTAASATSGSVVVSDPASGRVAQVATEGAQGVLTNLVWADWATTNHVPALVLETNVLVRAKAWDGLFWSRPVTSLPFMVDNEAPAAGGALTTPGATTETWRTTNMVSAAWGAADDGDGGGGVWYRYGAVQDPGSAPGPASSTTQTEASIAFPEDGTNWWIDVAALDRYGNQGASTSTGPFWLDTTPPDASSAVIAVDGAAGGDYVLGSVVTSSWSGVSDALSGVSNYYVAFTDGGGTTNGISTFSATHALSGASVDQTNTVYVWARDRAGLIGNAASQPVLVLSAGNDYDGDGISSGDEVMSGTDAADGGDVFAVSAIEVSAPTNDAAFVLRWESVSGRLYSLFRAGSLGGTNIAWAPVPLYTNLPGTGGPMSYTGTVSDADYRFFHLTVRRP